MAAHRRSAFRKIRVESYSFIQLHITAIKTLNQRVDSAYLFTSRHTVGIFITQSCFPYLGFAFVELDELGNGGDGVCGWGLEEFTSLSIQ